MDLDELINEFEVINVNEEFKNYDKNKNIYKSEIKTNIVTNILRLMKKVIFFEKY